ncbi:MAG: glycosyltransferase [Microbacterium sp.]
MSRILLVTWDGGGNVPPALGLAAELADRGHEVAILGHPAQRAAIEGAGVPAFAYRELPPWNPRRAQGSVGFALGYLRLLADGRFGREVRDAVAQYRPDAIVVDALLPAAMTAAIDTGVPTVVLVHTVLAAIEGIARGPVGRLAAVRGFSFRHALGDAAAIVIASPEPLATVPRPPRARYVGPIFGAHEPAAAAADPSSRRVLVSLSTIHYVGMREVLQGLVDAFTGLGVEAVVTTGPTIDPAELTAPPNVELRRSVPHAELLPHVGLVIGHGGHGTATKALSAGVPVLVRTMSGLGDHVYVARGLEHAGVGARLSRRSTTRELGERIELALSDAQLHRRAQELGVALRSVAAARAAADMVERSMDAGDRPEHPGSDHRMGAS